MRQGFEFNTVIGTLTIIVACVGNARTVNAQIPCRYEYTTWPNMDCGFGPDPGLPVSVNVHGHVAGRWSSCGEPVAMTFLWTGGPTTQILPIPPGYRAMEPAAMNDLGEIVGRLELPKGTSNPDRAFLRRANGQVIDLGLPPGGINARATSINNNSEITGYYTVPTVGYRVFVWRDGGFTNVPLSTSWEWATNFIDDDGQLAVYPFFGEGGIWANGKFQGAGLLPDGTWSQPKWISPNGRVVGTANFFDRTGERVRAVLYQSGQLFNLGVLPGFRDSFATGATDTAIVGYSQETDPPGGANIAFVYLNGTMRRLDQLQPSPNLILHPIPRISRNGLIAATGRLGISHVGVVLTPVFAPRGDVTGDCRVGVPDLLAVINSWGECTASPACPADVNSNGVVNSADLVLVIQHWGQQS